MAGAVAVHGSAPWFRSLVLLALLAANATPLLVRAEDTVAADRPLSGDRKIVSRIGKFALGFFQPDGGAAGHWYIGIWYHNISVQTPVWVANRDRPVSDPAAARLTIAADGNLVLLDASGALAWSTNSTTRLRAGRNASNATVVAVLLDTGNLVLAPSSNASDVLWQSFDHIGDTWLPGGGGKLRRDKLTGVIQGMTSWRSRGDPAPGLSTLQLDPAGAPQYVLLWNGTREYWATGNWNGRIFTGAPEVAASGRVRFVDDDRETYFTYSFADDSTVYRFVIDVSGQVKGWFWVEEKQAWNLVYAEPKAVCAVPRGCGAFGVCNEGDSAACSCARGFRPRNATSWSLDDFTGGCVRNVELQCAKNSSSSSKRDSAGGGLKAEEDRFFLMPNMRLPDDGRVVNGASSSGDCERACLGDCTCSAYAYNGSCILWHNDLQNLENNYVGAADAGSLYLRLAASELTGDRNHKRKTIVIVIATLATVCFVVAASVLVIRTAIARRARKVHGHTTVKGGVASFKYRDLQSFTKNFSDKLGGGAFGSVYRGQLPDQTTIAVKKLEGLRQGEKQFRAEVSTLGTVQHVNLIRLLGFCSDRKLLVYEYMTNGSLDRHLFGATMYALSWRARYRIAVGVAKGLSYLHDECRDCIIHCDVKPENILLDADFAPKVADFGLAKLVGRDFSRVLTTMRGTVGYLAPEWIGGEAVTAKADVFSYGMMLFEIVSGRRNVAQGRTESGSESAAVGGGNGAHAAAGTTFFPVLVARRLAETEGDMNALLDPEVGGDVDAEEVRRVCKVACWCIQDEVDARPTMAEVVQMLEGKTDIEVPPVPRYLEVLAGRATST